MNTTFSQPTEKALKNAKTQYSSPLVKEVFMNGFEPENCIDHFGVSTLIERNGFRFVNDLTFTKKTGKLVSSICVEISLL